MSSRGFVCLMIIGASVLAVLSRPSLHAGTIRGPSGLTAARAAQPVIAPLVQADEAARSAEAAYNAQREDVQRRIASVVGPRASRTAIETALQPYRRPLADAARAYAKAEAVLSKQRDGAWRAIRITRAAPTLVDEPLQLAFLDLQIELRRALGTHAHTRVPGLENDRGCAGDLVVERLVHQYGQAATTLASPPPGELPASSDMLRRIAMQFACLSARQLSALEGALTGGFEATVGRLRRHGLGHIVPAFARQIAPVQVLLLDVRKHRGSRSAAWKWFLAYSPRIRAEVTRLGWPGGALWLWDRLAGRMVGYPACTTTSSRLGDCVDVRLFLESLADPRALGRGDCALAAMISRGLTTLPDRGQRYVCPSLACEEPATTAGGPTGMPRRLPGALGPLIGGPRPEALGLPWPDLSLSDVATMRSFCVPADAGTRLQGDEIGECLFSQTPENPFDRYQTCVAEGVTGDPPVIGSFPGVPMGSQCKFAADGDEVTAPPSPSPDEPPPDEPPPDEPPPADDSSVVADILDAIVDFIVDAFGGEVAGTANELLSPEGAAAELGAAQMLTEQALREAWMDGTISDKDYFDNHGKKPAEIADFLQKKRGGTQSCVDPLDCSSTCTGLGFAVEKLRACTDQLLDDLLTAAGRPRREPPPTRTIDWVANWHPDMAPVEEVDMCLPGGDTGPTRVSPACGLVLCPNGDATASASNQCCGGQVGGALPVHSSCLTLRCPDGVPSDDGTGRCTCKTAEPVVGTGPEPVPFSRPGELTNVHRVRTFR